ncbi:MAG: PIN domain-containing protein [Proteobacteria bacterium]|nr:PIN domain-containing protein [Pseudomonadota bacterium]
MILVDTSIWIDLFSKRPKYKVSVDQLTLFVTCLPVIQEVIQGLKPGNSSEKIRDGMLALPRVCDPLGIDIYLHAADIYKQGRSRGLTIRSSSDCLIAAIAIESKLAIWHSDRDFAQISRFTNLQSIANLF